MKLHKRNFRSVPNPMYVSKAKDSEAKITVDDALSNTSENPVQNKVITNALNGIKTYHEFNSNWRVNSTTENLCQDIIADDKAVQGMAYVGKIYCSDLPASLVQGECVIEIIANDSSNGKNIHLILTSVNQEPYHWEYSYAKINGTYGSSAGWVGYQVEKKLYRHTIILTYTKSTENPTDEYCLLSFDILNEKSDTYNMAALKQFFTNTSSGTSQYITCSGLAKKTGENSKKIIVRISPTSSSGTICIDGIDFDNPSLIGEYVGIETIFMKEMNNFNVTDRVSVNKI